jgi:hypothetical protein
MTKTKQKLDEKVNNDLQTLNWKLKIEQPELH